MTTVVGEWIAAGLSRGETRRSSQWPARPYRGLDFYREEDAPLFRERGDDVRECAHMLLGFGIKILVLQGSSGAGKSSFLHAGLIPFLRHNTEHPSFFLNAGKCVIRCTTDPLQEIAGALFSALHAGSVCLGLDPDDGLDKGKRDHMSAKLNELLSAPRLLLADKLVCMLKEICSDLPGRLVLVLDNAEEVLTRGSGSQVAGDESAAFFRFLEEIYIRNIDVRIIVSLRTEYYGRFRDELRIVDDRLGNRPRSGGIEPYFLKPLREKGALLRAIQAPAQARHEDGKPVYGFEFEEGAAEEIVDDVLAAFPHGAVTPLLQVICATLYDRLAVGRRKITAPDYRALGGTSGISDAYVERGIMAATGISGNGAQMNRWYLLLHSLVSRQGGGTVVTMTESLGELQHRADKFELGGNIKPVLGKLCGGKVPLLHGEPRKNPVRFSLRHDFLALVFARWEIGYSAQVKEHEAADRQQRKVKVGWAFLLLGSLAVLATSACFNYRQSKELFAARTQKIEAWNSVAVSPLRSDFRLSLLLFMANLDMLGKDRKLLNPFAHDYESLEKQTLAAFRRTLPRMPWLNGQYLAAGIEPGGNRIAMLRRDGKAIEIFTLSPQAGYQDFPAPEVRFLSPPPAQDTAMRFPAAVGFIAGLGPAAFLGGDIYYWRKDGQPASQALLTRLPADFTEARFPRVEFIAGVVQVTAAGVSAKDKNRIDVRVLRLAASDLLDMRHLDAGPPILLDRFAPRPVFSDAPNGAYGFMSEPVPEGAWARLHPFAADQEIPWSDRLRQPSQFELNVGYLGRDGAGRVAARIPLEKQSPYARHRFGLAFLANRDAVLVKQNDGSLYLYGLSDAAFASEAVTVGSPRIIRFEPPKSLRPRGRQGGDEDLRFSSGGNPWTYPPLAAVAVEQHVRAAWLSSEGVWAVEESGKEPGKAAPVLNMEGPLISGEQGGSRLQFTRDGNFLMLQQRRQFDSTMHVRVWDLRPGSHDWIRQASQEQLRAAACRLVKTESRGGTFTDLEVTLYQIDSEHRELCPDPDGAK